MSRGLGGTSDPELRPTLLEDVRASLVEAVRVTDEALLRLERAERTAGPEGVVEIRRVRADVQSAARTILDVLLGVLESETGRAGHSRRVGAIVRRIADVIGMPGEEAAQLELGARLHDVGELLLDWEPLARSDKLAAVERRTLRRHPMIGERILRTLGVEEGAARAVGAHHERLDGSGYPDRIEGERVPLGAQILAVADSYEAMTHPRPHRPAMTSTEAVRRLRREAVARRLNRQAVEALVALS